MRSSTRFFAIGAIFVLAACATSGSVDKTFTPNQAVKAIFVFERQSESEARQINQVIRTFERYGYDVTKDKTQAAYYLGFSIKGGLVVTVGDIVVEGRGWQKRIERGPTIVFNFDVADVEVADRGGDRGVQLGAGSGRARA